MNTRIGIYPIYSEMSNTESTPALTAVRCRAQLNIVSADPWKPEMHRRSGAGDVETGCGRDTPRAVAAKLNAACLPVWSEMTMAAPARELRIPNRLRTPRSVVAAEDHAPTAHAPSSVPTNPTQEAGARMMTRTGMRTNPGTRMPGTSTTTIPG